MAKVIGQKIFFKAVSSYTLRVCLFIAYLSLAILPLGSSAQENIDSLKASLTQVDGVDKLGTLNRLFKAISDTDYELALNYADQFEALANKLGDSTKIVEGKRMQAYSLIDLGRNEQAVSILQSALSIAERNKDSSPALKKQIKFILNNAGIASMYNGNLDKSLEYHFKSLIYREEEGDVSSICTALNNIGLVYYKLSDPKNAIDYYSRALELKEKSGKREDIELVFINLGLCYNLSGDFDKAISQFEQGLAACGVNCPKDVLREGLFGLGKSHYLNKEYGKSEEEFKQSLSISLDQNNQRFQCESLYYLSLIEDARGDTAKSFGYLEDAVTKLGSTTYETRIAIFKHFSKLYEERGDFQNATRYFKMSSNLKDSIYNESLIRNLAVVQTNYAERANLKTINEQNEVIALKDQLLGKQRTITAMAVVIALLLLGFTYFAIQSQRAYNTRLKRHNEVLEVKVQERTKELVETMAELDALIYKSYHDLKGPLSRLKGLSTLISMDPVNVQEYNEQISKTSDQLNENLLRLQRLSEINKHHVKNEYIDLTSFVGERLDSLRDHPNRASIKLTLDLKAKSLHSDRELFSEAFTSILQNAFDYAKVNRGGCEVIVKSWRSEGKVFLAVSDNGVGIPQELEPSLFGLFSKGEVAAGAGLGLHLAKFSIEKAGGTIAFERGDMTTFKLSVPDAV